MLNQRENFKQLNVGFTLVELMITLAIAAILVTVAVPSFMSMIASNRVSAATNEMVTTLNLAKSESIRSGLNTVICKSNTTGDQCNNGGNWSDGWLLFSDSNGNRSINSGEQIIRIHAAPDASLNFIFVNSANAIEFHPNGTPNVSGRFCLQNSYDAANSRAVLLYQSGRIHTEVRDGANDNCGI